MSENPQQEETRSHQPASTQPAATSSSAEKPRGGTAIAPQVVQKITGLAAREVSGIHAMGGGASRAFGAVRERVPGAGTAQTAGVRVEVGEKQAAIDLDVIAEYGAPIVDLTRTVRRNVISAVQQMAGLEVIEVNIAVNDVHVPSEGNGEQQSAAPSRVE
ncbi:Asp23/Gls24 family envelope stress response protein [Haloactinomyces albus]|uniref:Alkaline shock family protein YloU n=1 Tax=Haloactinomyces albus TaxID=1352928 RepID=A0AAE3Z8I5_9ACTN|nr:Asp23/Gls24 family envelope stress response protein [Haloactinomyces albus]MDR7300288.1 putative alkaline shock family protein YloU [Haloactinomyces albus]